jgi:hypothetical protein
VCHGFDSQPGGVKRHEIPPAQVGLAAATQPERADLREELQFHLDEDTEDRTADGLPIHGARRAARLDLGNLAIVREDTRAAWGWTLLEQLAQDVRYGVRMLAEHKVFSALAILSLALGIGANTAIVSFMDAMLMRSLPVRDGATLLAGYVPVHNASRINPMAALRHE